ncbi:MAG: hypothetical protein VX777_01250 [Chlamydiota bacterium]|nr:hypothetical protein [Chlamydiota bacterium]
MTITERSSPERLTTFNSSQINYDSFNSNRRKLTTTDVAHNALSSLTSDEYPSIGIICNLLRKKFSKNLVEETDTQILLVIKLVCESENTHRFFLEGKKNVLHFDEHTMSTFSKLKKYNNKETIDELSEKNIDPGLRRLVNVICHEMAGLYLRDTVKIKKFNFEEKKITYYENFGHVSNNGSIVKKLTLSSDILKHHYSSTRNYNLNLSRITQKLPGGILNHLIVRSGRSDNESRLWKLVQYSYLSALGADNKPGITLNENGLNTFQLSLYTAQDPHPVRNVIKKFKQRKKIPRDEKTSLRRMVQCINNIWKDKTAVPIQVHVSKGDTEISHVFLAKKPIIKNFVLSKSAHCREVIIESRDWSLEGTLQEFNLLRNTKQVIKHPLFTELFTHFNSMVPTDTTPTKQQVIDFLAKIDLISMLETSHDPLVKKIYFALKAIKISLTNSDFTGREFDKPNDPGTELVYHYYLSELINTSLAVQCKAGCDRALIMVSLFLAKVQIEREYNHLIDLANLSDDQMEKYFISEFKDFCVKFGVPILNICRGRPNMKARDKPILEELLGPLTAKSIPGLKLVTGT